MDYNFKRVITLRSLNVRVVETFLSRQAKLRPGSRPSQILIRSALVSRRFVSVLKV